MVHWSDDETSCLEFTRSEQVAISNVISQVKDWLLAQKGMLVTALHYPARFSRQSSTLEQFGLLRHRQSPYQDRFQVLISKQGLAFVVSYEVDLGVSTMQDTLETLADRRAQYRTGTRQYANHADDLSLLTNHLKEYLLHQFIPFDCHRT